MRENLVTINGRFAHRWAVGEDNTICGANPSYYPRVSVMLRDNIKFRKTQRLTAVEASKLHKCKKCWP